MALKRSDIAARAQFWRSAGRRGWKWLSGVFGHIERAIAIVAIVGLPIGGVALLDVGWWAALAGVGAALLLVLGEGAFLTWREPMRELEEQKKDVELRRKLADMCFEWIADVENFLDARSAAEPHAPRGGVKEQAMNPVSLTTEQRNIRDNYRRETVSLYIERHRNRGMWLFDTLVALGLLVDTGRQQVHSPPTPYDILNATEIIQAGADRLVLRWERA